MAFGFVVPATAVLLYRRPTVQGELLQMQGAEELAPQLVDEGWVQSSSSSRLGMELALVVSDGPVVGDAPAAQAEESALAVRVLRDKGGRKRKDRKDHEQIAMGLGAALRNATKAHIADRRLSTEPIAPRSSQGAPTLIATCDRCKIACCPKQRCFQAVVDDDGANKLCAQTFGCCAEAEEELNYKRLKLDNARRLSHPIPSKVANNLEMEKVPAQAWPDDWQVKHQRRRKPETELEPYSAARTGALQLFVDNPPEGVTILPGAVCQQDRVRIAFRISSAVRLSTNVGFPILLMDFTSKANQDTR
ncbi:unnamed protein product, partial [Prorocentrum cordatum]